MITQRSRQPDDQQLSVRPVLHPVDPIRHISRICSLAGNFAFVEDARRNLRQASIDVAILRRDTPIIFDLLLTSFSFQGVSDQAARSYMQANGRASWAKMQASMTTSSRPSCHRLRSFDHYAGCRYDKGSCTCAEPEYLDECPVPTEKLRNGRLNQTAYSFYLFVRDVAGGDLVGWIDDRLRSVSQPPKKSPQALAAGSASRLIEPLRRVFGVSDKILTMAFSDILIGAGPIKPQWFDAGISMVAIDTLVHNHMHRSGILASCGTSHGYGVGCYAPGGCAEIIRQAAQAINAKRFNREFPVTFPRFVQHAIWRYCSADGLDVCNGNRIDDRQACLNRFCSMFEDCAKMPLKCQ